MDTNQRKNEKESLRFACSAFYSHKWQLDILFCLFDGPMHFGELLRQNKALLLANHIMSKERICPILSFFIYYFIDT